METAAEDSEAAGWEAAEQVAAEKEEADGAGCSSDLARDFLTLARCLSEQLWPPGEMIPE